MGKLFAELRRNDPIMVNIRRKNYKKKNKTEQKSEVRSPARGLALVSLHYAAIKMKRETPASKRRVFSVPHKRTEFHRKKKKKERKKKKGGRKKEKNLRRDPTGDAIMTSDYRRRSEVNRPSWDRVVHADAARASSRLSRQVAPSTW